MPCSTSERSVIRSALQGSQIWAATISRLFIWVEGTPNWTNTNVQGALSFHRNGNTTFLSLIDLATGKIAWQHEVYKELLLNSLPAFLYFASDNGKFVFGFLFLNCAEAEDFLAVFSKHHHHQQPQPQPEEFKVARPIKMQPPPPPTIALSTANHKVETVAPKGKKKGKVRVGNPTNFRHLSHIGFDPEGGFELQNIPPEWRNLFEKAGVTREQLENKDTAEFIVDFVEKRGGPPVPPRRRSETLTATASDNAAIAPVKRECSDSQVMMTPECSKPRESIPSANPSLLQSIRQAGGASSLKKAPVASAEETKDAPETGGDMAALLAQALKQRRLEQQEASTSSEGE